MRLALRFWDIVMGVFSRGDNRPWIHKVQALASVFSGLRGRLLGLVLLAVCPPVILTYYTNAAWRRHDIEDANRFALLLTRHAAWHQEQAIKEAHEVLVGLSEVAAAGRNDPGWCTRTIATLKTSFPHFANFGVIRPEGGVACSAMPLEGPLDLRDRPFFRRALESRGVVAEEYQVGSVPTKAAAQFARSVSDDTGRVHAVVFATTELEWLGSIVHAAKLSPGTTVTVIDQDGAIVAREPDGKEWVGRSVSETPGLKAIAGEQRLEGTSVASDVDGERKLLAFRSLGEARDRGRFAVVVGVPLAEEFAEADAILNRNLAALGAAAISVILLAWVGSEVFVLGRVRAMLRMTQRVTAGDLAARSGVRTGSDEIYHLASAFDNMAAELERRDAETRFAEGALLTANQQLEKRIQERTAHLVAANEAQQVALRDLKRVEDHLRESQAQLAGIIESTMEAMITVDEDRRVLLFNRAAERIFRLPAAEAIGQPVDRFIPERCRAAHEAGLRRLDRTGAAGIRIGEAGSAFGLRADGEEFPIEAAISQVEVRGEMLYTITLRDISERLKTEALVRKLSMAVEKTTESVLVTNRDGVIEYVNGSFERQTGYRREEAIGKTPAILKSGHHDAGFYGELWKRILSGDVFSGVFLNRRKNGETFYEERSITPIRGDGQSVTHFVATGRDITRRKRTEEALRRLNIQLEREAERIAHALHDDAGQFLTSAHITLADMARDIPDSAQSRLREVREHLMVIEEQLRRLSHELRPRILDDLGLDAALEFLADGVMKRTGMVVTTEVTLEKRLPQVVETTLYRLIQEALTNAAKHARARQVNVLVTRDARTIRCTIRDDGVGFDAAEILARRGDPSLGLVGSRDRVEALGGTLGITSTPGKGTELLCLIPVDSTES